MMFLGSTDYFFVNELRKLNKLFGSTNCTNFHE